MPVVGFLGNASPQSAASFVAAFREGLSETGFIEGQNVTIEYRWAEGHYDRLPAFAAEFVSRKVDVILASAGVGIAAAKGATSTIPIVFFGGDDLVAAGLVASLARPGGNLTGFSIFAPELNPKRFQLLSELVPHVQEIALLVNPTGSSLDLVIRDVEEAARASGRRLSILKASTEDEIDTALATLVQSHAGGLVVMADPFFNSCQGSPPIWFNATCPRLRPLAFRLCCAAKAATTTIPIIFATGVNPVTAGLVASFNRPGGNLTGISMSAPAWRTKQIEMLHEIVPKAEVMGVIVNPTNPGYEACIGRSAGRCPRPEDSPLCRARYHRTGNR